MLLLRLKALLCDFILELPRLEVVVSVNRGQNGYFLNLRLILRFTCADALQKIADVDGFILLWALLLVQLVHEGPVLVMLLNYLLHPLVQVL